MADYSSRGPTTDLRIKPEVMCPGDNIRSARAGSLDEYSLNSGTSMAVPMCAGASAIVRQYLIASGLGGPTAALVKVS